MAWFWRRVLNPRSVAACSTSYSMLDGRTAACTITSQQLPRVHGQLRVHKTNSCTAPRMCANPCMLTCRTRCRRCCPAQTPLHTQQQRASGLRLLCCCTLARRLEIQTRELTAGQQTCVCTKVAGHQTSRESQQGIDQAASSKFQLNNSESLKADKLAC
jgi:hypothetical protein